MMMMNHITLFRLQDGSEKQTIYSSDLKRLNHKINHKIKISEMKRGLLFSLQRAKKTSKNR